MPSGECSSSYQADDLREVSFAFPPEGEVEAALWTDCSCNGVASLKALANE